MDAYIWYRVSRVAPRAGAVGERPADVRSVPAGWRAAVGGGAPRGRRGPDHEPALFPGYRDAVREVRNARAAGLTVSVREIGSGRPGTTNVCAWSPSWHASPMRGTALAVWCRA